MPDSIIGAVEDWQGGDEQAAYELDRRLRAELLALVRSRRQHHLRPEIDSEGVVNAALKSFLSGVRNDEFSRLTGRNDVKKLLATFAIRILKDQIRAAHALKRDVRRAVRGDTIHVGGEVSAKEPTPEECLMAIEYWEKFPEVVRGVHQKSIDILECSLEGLSPVQIAQETGMGVRTVQVIIQRMIDTWNMWVAREGQHGERTRGSD